MHQSSASDNYKICRFRCIHKDLLLNMLGVLFFTVKKSTITVLQSQIKTGRTVLNLAININNFRYLNYLIDKLPER